MLQKVAKKLHKSCQISKNQIDNLVGFEKCCKTCIHLKRSAPIQPKTSEILPKFAKNCQLPASPPPCLPASDDDGGGPSPRAPRAGARLDGRHGPGASRGQKRSQIRAREPSARFGQRSSIVAFFEIFGKLIDIRRLPGIYCRKQM